MPEWIITSQESGDKLLSFLIKRLEGKYSARFLKRIIENNGCQINGRTQRFASTPLTKGDHIIFNLEQIIPQTPKGVETRRILYEDEALLVYDKPAGMTSDEKGIGRLLKSHAPHLILVHRLDRDTTGVLIFAKDPAIFEQLIEQFKQFKVQKRYCTIVDGLLAGPQGVIENYLGRKQAYAGQTFWGAVKASKGLYACTEWQRLKLGKKASLVACFPKTGRTHQIRVHLAGIGHPILGDFQYGKHFECSYRPPYYLLHAEEIHFHHPLTGEPLRVKAPLPDEFKKAKRQLFTG